VRYLLLSSHYRTQLNFTFAGLDGARASLARIGDLVDRLKVIRITATSSNGQSMLALLEKANQKFKDALADDLNIAIALAALFDLVRELNRLADEERLSSMEAAAALEQLEEWDRVLGVLPLHRKEEAPPALQQLLAERELARREKNFQRSDALRDQILAAGYFIEDTPHGARLKRK
jgi:cysteinyl-tRNA synthetase